MASIKIIGGGLSGLTLARNLLDMGFDVKVVETRGRVGGISILDAEAMSIIDRIIGDITVEKYSTAVRVSGLVKIVSSRGVEDVKLGVTATGFRVLTPIELNIVGDRPAGIYPYHTVLDLITENLAPGRYVALYGLNRYSVLLARQLLNYVRKVYIVDPQSVSSHEVSEIEVLKGNVRRVKGTGRLSHILVDGNIVEVDTLILAMFKPWNPFPELPAVGHAVLEVYDPRALVEASRLQAINLACEDSNKVRVYVSNPEIQVFPRQVSRCLREILIVRRSGGKIMVNGRVYNVTGDYVIVEIPRDVESVQVSSV